MRTEFRGTRQKYFEKTEAPDLDAIFGVGLWGAMTVLPALVNGGISRHYF